MSSLSHVQNILNIKKVPRNAIILDFETYPIRPRPAPRPDPVGLAVSWPGKKPFYMAFAHPGGGNTHTRAQVLAELKKVWASGLPIVAHNARFDLMDICREKFGLPQLDNERLHDTEVLLFLKDPRATTYALKPNAESLLGMSKADRDLVEEWLLEHQPVMPKIRLVTNKKPDNKKWKEGKPWKEYVGAYIAYAPVAIVGPYAIGDVVKCRGIFEKVGDEIIDRGMLPSYYRERDLFFPIWGMEAAGVPVNHAKLQKDAVELAAALVTVDKWLTKKVGGAKVNWDSPKAVGTALAKADLIDLTKLPFTPKSLKAGKPRRSMKKELLPQAVSDPQVLPILQYRSRLVSTLRSFVLPWLKMANTSGGKIFTAWFTTRKDDKGARTGRLSSSPNFQNMTKKKVKLFEGKVPAWWKRLKLPDLPFVREYIEALPGHVLVDRDYSQQELRVLAHYVKGLLLEKYLLDPWFDFHEYARIEVSKLLGREILRDDVKSIVFGLLYGMGLKSMAPKLKTDVKSAADMREAVLMVVPELKDLLKKLKARAKAKQPIRTWGGREYHVEPSRIVDGQFKDFGYKLINVLIQAGSADVTKEAVLNFWRMQRANKFMRAWRLLLTVHDELVLSVPLKDVAKAHKALDACMADVKFRVSMRSEGKTGPNLANLKPYDKKGKLVDLPLAA